MAGSMSREWEAKGGAAEFRARRRDLASVGASSRGRGEVAIGASRRERETRTIILIDLQLDPTTYQEEWA